LGDGIGIYINSYVKIMPIKKDLGATRNTSDGNKIPLNVHSA
jgi:hypothetical protein